MNNIDKKQPDSSFVPGYDVDHAALAYIKPIATNGGNAFAVCTENGIQLAVYNSRDAAVIAARQHDLEPVHIH